jgi:hypothetical protein
MFVQVETSMFSQTALIMRNKKNFELIFQLNIKN